jgi:exopolysaccharide biosynthesis protein
VSKLFGKRYWWAFVYSVILTLSTTYVLLDAFVIPKPIKAVPKPAHSSLIEPKPASAVPAASKARPDITARKATEAAIQPEPDSPDAGRSIAPEENRSTERPLEESVSTPAPLIESPAWTATSYRDANIHIEISSKRYANTQIYIADITLKNPAHLKTAFAKNVFGRNITQTTSLIATSHNAILAINGDFCGFRNEGFVIRNGVLYRSMPRRTGDDGALVHYQDGSFKSVGENTVTAEALIAKGAVQVFSFGPSLLEDGGIKVNPRTEVGRGSASNPRTAVGMISPLRYLFIVSDGRTRSNMGLSLYQLATLFKEQGCQVAYNLDGGGSSTMWFDGNVINFPNDGRRYGERKVSDIVYIGYE